MRAINEKHIALRRQSGMTLMEILVTSLIASAVLSVVVTLTIFAMRSVLAMTNYTDLDQDSRNTLDLLTRDIRKSSSLASFAANKIVLKNLDDNTTCTYVYNQTAGTLTRSNSSGSKVLLQSCDQLTFHIFTKAPSSGFKFNETTDPASAKLIDVSWRCSRQIRAQKLNTESIQTAKIVMRN